MSPIFLLYLPVFLGTILIVAGLLRMIYSLGVGEIERRELTNSLARTTDVPVRRRG